VKFNKDHIISEIKRIAIANGGKPPGRLVFEGETGIKQSDWYPDIWLRWGEALAEAGYAPNELTSRIEDEVVIQKYIGLVRAYWHRRFDDKRGEGEWFELTVDDVKAFKRWKRIV
jgi:hypothetical protein